MGGPEYIRHAHIFYAHKPVARCTCGATVKIMGGVRFALAKIGLAIFGVVLSVPLFASAVTIPSFPDVPTGSQIVAQVFGALKTPQIPATPVAPDTGVESIGLSGAVNADAFSAGSDGISAAAVTPAVAMLTIFADPTASLIGSSGGFTIDGGTHAFIMIKNVSSSNINVGKFSGIAPGKMMSLGTWSSTVQPLHNGLWYDLESYKVSINGFYKGRVSVSYLMTATQLTTLNTFIINNDFWSTPTNCSSFAYRAWNSIVETTYQLSAGIPNTPKNLANNIKSKFPTYYLIGSPAVPYYYAVYYANGTKSPTQTNSFK